MFFWNLKAKVLLQLRSWLLIPKLTKYLNRLATTALNTIEHQCLQLLSSLFQTPLISYSAVGRIPFPRLWTAIIRLSCDKAPQHNETIKLPALPYCRRRTNGGCIVAGSCSAVFIELITCLDKLSAHNQENLTWCVR